MNLRSLIATLAGFACTLLLAGSALAQGGELVRVRISDVIDEFFERRCSGLVNAVEEKRVYDTVSGDD